MQTRLKICFIPVNPDDPFSIQRRIYALLFDHICFSAGLNNSGIDQG